ncbi:protein kinase domain-containing protein [Paenibacillus lautus]|uniref:protein kinase domain-containing protein n=1 Tax=Paenibacillus lautus TaxID=1401 RepID=UPI003D2CDFEE
MLKIPGYTITGIVYEDSYITVAYARSERTRRTMLLKIVKEGSRTTIENAKLIHEYHFLNDLNVDGLFKPVSYLSFKTMIVLEFEPIHAITLREYVRIHGSSPSVLIPMLERAARRLQDLHTRDVLHLNIRPDTLLVQESTQDVYLTGFGYAVRRDQLNLQGHVSLEANPIYMSPEQTGRMSHRLDGRADMYSLGVTFYELFAHRLPFTANGALPWAHAHLTIRPDPFHDIHLPQWISELILNMLEKDPDDRYLDMRSIAEKIARHRLAVESDTDAKRCRYETRQNPSASNSFQQHEALTDKDEGDKSFQETVPSMSLSGHIVNYPQVLDLAAIMQASHIFNSVIAMERVAERFMQLLVMNAGAHRGLMLMLQDGKWYVEAAAKMDGRRLTASSQRTLLEDAHGVSRRLLIQTAESQAALHGPTATPGMVELNSTSSAHSTKGSVLYFPIVIQDQLLGVLFLQNEMSTKAFAPDRFHVLSTIASQALFAIHAKVRSHAELPLSEHGLQSAKKRAGGVHDLTGREKEVLRLISKGLSNKEIAAALTITNETVKTHIKKIFEKLKVDRRGKAAAIANTLGLLHEDRPFPE